MASSEIFVFGSFIKHILYAISMLALYFILRWETWYVFLAHSGIWIVGFFYVSSDQTNFWFSTIAGILSVALVCVDAWLFLVTSCYLFGRTCCIGESQTSPFSLGFPVCGPSDRYQTQTLVVFALVTIGLGILTGLGRTSSIMNTRKASSNELMLCVLFAGIKIYMLFWDQVSFSAFFVTQTFISIAGNASAVFVGYKFKSIATIIFVAVIGLDLLVLLGATDAISFIEKAPLVGNIGGVHFHTRHLLIYISDQPDSISLSNFLGSDARKGLTYAASTLSAFDATNGPEQAREALDTAVGALQSFNMGVERACYDSSVELVGFECKKAHVSALAILTITEETPCCDRNTRFDLVIAGLSKKINEYEANFNTLWQSEMKTYQQKAFLIQTAEQQKSVLDTVSEKIKFDSTLKILWNSIKRVWFMIIGKNVQTSQTPWITSTGKIVPASIKWAWVGVHSLCMTITLMELFNCWSRDRSLRTPFGAKYLNKPEPEDSQEEFNMNVLPSSVSTPRQRKLAPLGI